MEKSRTAMFRSQPAKAKKVEIVPAYLQDESSMITEDSDDGNGPSSSVSWKIGKKMVSRTGASAYCQEAVRLATKQGQM